MGQRRSNPVSAMAGHAFAMVFRTIKTVRPGRPIHPEGVALTGTLERHSGHGASGIPWIDSAGTDRVSARFSRSLGLPDALPDILGLAVRIPQDMHHDRRCADVLLASTGASRTGRFLLTLHRAASAAVFSTLMPYKAPSGPVLLAARTLHAPAALPAAPGAFRRALGHDAWVLGLYFAHPRENWTQFGTLTLELDSARPDTGERFDPILNPLPTTQAYPWARRLREPSYRTARRPPQESGLPPR